MMARARAAGAIAAHRYRRMMLAGLAAVALSRLAGLHGGWAAAGGMSVSVGGFEPPSRDAAAIAQRNDAPPLSAIERPPP